MRGHGARQPTKGNDHSRRDPHHWGCKAHKLTRAGDPHHTVFNTTARQRAGNSVKLRFQHNHPETGVALLWVMPAHCCCPTCKLLYIDSINTQTFLECFPTVTHTPASCFYFLAEKKGNRESGNTELNLQDFCLFYSAGKASSQYDRVSPRAGNMPIRTPAIHTFVLTLENRHFRWRSEFSKKCPAGFTCCSSVLFYRIWRNDII